MLAISLTNREQSILLLPMQIALSIIFYKLKMNHFLHASVKITMISAVIVFCYLLISILQGNKTLWDTIHYTMNNYGYFDNTYSVTETLSYLFKQVYLLHTVFVRDLISHHIWSLISTFSIVGTVIALKKITLINTTFILSGLASYSFVFLFPELSYRYYFPIIISICYFCSYFLSHLVNLSTKGRD